MTFVAPDPHAGTTLYHLGLDLNCPVDQARAGAIRLVKRSERVTFDHHGNTQRSQILGAYARLTPEQVTDMREGIKRMAIRQVGAGEFVCLSTGPRPWVMGKTEKPGEYGPEEAPVYGTRRIRPPQPGDVPLAQFVFFREAEALPDELSPTDRPFLEEQPAESPEPKRTRAASKTTA